MRRLLALVTLLFACEPPPPTCGPGEIPIDRSGDEIVDDCAAVVEGGLEGDPCAFGHDCAEGLLCFFTSCAGDDCALDVGECSPNAV